MPPEARVLERNARYLSALRKPILAAGPDLIGAGF